MKRLIAIPLMLIVLLVNSGLTMATHSCRGYVVKTEFQFGLENLDCGMGNMNHSPIHSDEPQFRSNCCENDYYQYEVSEFENFNFSFHLIPAELPAQSNLPIVDLNAANVPFYGNYFPPPIEIDIPIFIQSFRI